MPRSYLAGSGFIHPLWLHTTSPLSPCQITMLAKSGFPLLSRSSFIRLDLLEMEAIKSTGVGVHVGTSHLAFRAGFWLASRLFVPQWSPWWISKVRKWVGLTQTYQWAICLHSFPPQPRACARTLISQQQCDMIGSCFASSSHETREIR